MKWLSSHYLFNRIKDSRFCRFVVDFDLVNAIIILPLEMDKVALKILSKISSEPDQQYNGLE
jgi:hypothetical protein